MSLSRSVVASAPGRVDLSGGATDWCGYHTLSVAINLRATATLTRLDDPRLICIKIGQEEETYQHPKYGSSLDLFKAVIELSGLKGFGVEYQTEIPKGSGLGGSAPLTVSTLYGLKHLFKQNWSLYYIAELAQQAETYKLQMVNGHQDQYSAVFGGLAYYDFRGKASQKGQTSQPIETTPYATHEDLNAFAPDLYLVVVIPKIIRSSSDSTNGALSERYLNGEAKIVKAMKRKAQLTWMAKKALVDGKMPTVYKIIMENQDIMRQFGFVSDVNEAIEKAALKLGALAVKNTGAGLGAQAIFCQSKDHRQEVFLALSKNKHVENIFKVEIDEGVRVEKE